MFRYRCNLNINTFKLNGSSLLLLSLKYHDVCQVNRLLNSSKSLGDVTIFTIRFESGTLLSSDRFLYLYFPQTNIFCRFCRRRLLKIVWQKEKLLIKTNFFICHTIFNFIHFFFCLFYEWFPYLFYYISLKSSVADLVYVWNG